MPHNRPPRMGGGFRRSHSPHFRGGRYQSGRSHGNPICCLIISIPICVLAFTIAGFALIFSSNDRVQRIQL